MLCLALIFALSDPPVRLADSAYAAVREHRWEEAAGLFRRAVDGGPASASLLRDYSYLLLKIGERDQARAMLERAVELQPGDEAAQLELAYLSYETGRRAEARRLFRRLGESAAEERVKAAAGAAFARIDGELAQGIRRWEEALRLAPRQWSGHEELARLAEQRDELGLAAEHYEEALRLRPQKAELLLDLARVRMAAGEREEARRALAAAARRGSARVVETAREMAGGELPEGSALEIAAAPPVEEVSYFSSREMGLRSLEESYLEDALHYLTLAVREDPRDGEAALNLAGTLNLLKRDREALRWYRAAAKSSDAAIARQGAEAYGRLKETAERVRVSAWAIPLYSSRWRDTFFYGQVRGEWKTGTRVTPYVSLRFVGDSRGRNTPGVSSLPQYLSETNLIAGAGVGVKVHPKVYAWAEGGEAISYLGRRVDSGLARPDYRGGVSMLKGWGHLLGGERGWFAETGVDGVYVSRFQNDVLVYGQTRGGYTFAKRASGWQAQVLGHLNVSTDRAGFYWANLVEAGPGVRVRLPGLPEGLSVRAEVLRGAHLRNAGNPRRPNYWDVRIGMWYVYAH